MSDQLHWTRLLAFVTGIINQEVLLRNEYLTAENRIPYGQKTRSIHHAKQWYSTFMEFRTGRCRYSRRIRGLPAGTIVDQNRTWHTRQRTPDTRISSHLPALTPNHNISSWVTEGSGAVVVTNSTYEGGDTAGLPQGAATGPTGGKGLPERMSYGPKIYL